jgi:hypothetical protein
MPVPTINVGDLASSAFANTWFVPLAASKAADTSRASNTTLSNDPDLVVNVAANAVYFMHQSFVYQSPTGSDIKLAWIAPAGSAGWHLLGRLTTGLTATTVGSGATMDMGAVALGTTITAGSLTGTNIQCFMTGTLRTSGTAGTLAFQWCQNVSSGTAAIIRANSSLMLQRIG